MQNLIDDRIDEVFQEDMYEAEACEAYDREYDELRELRT